MPNAGRWSKVWRREKLAGTNCYSGAVEIESQHECRGWGSMCQPAQDQEGGWVSLPRRGVGANRSTRPANGASGSPPLALGRPRVARRRGQWGRRRGAWSGWTQAGVAWSARGKEGGGVEDGGGWVSPWEWKWLVWPDHTAQACKWRSGPTCRRDFTVEGPPPKKKQSEAAQQIDLLAASPSPPPQLPRDSGHGEPPAGLLPHLHLVRPRSTPLLSVWAGRALPA